MGLGCDLTPRRLWRLRRRLGVCESVLGRGEDGNGGGAGRRSRRVPGRAHFTWQRLVIGREGRVTPAGTGVPARCSGTAGRRQYSSSPPRSGVQPRFTHHCPLFSLHPVLELLPVTLLVTLESGCPSHRWGKRYECGDLPAAVWLQSGVQMTLWSVTLWVVPFLQGSEHRPLQLGSVLILYSCPSITDQSLVLGRQGTKVIGACVSPRCPWFLLGSKRVGEWVCV